MGVEKQSWKEAMNTAIYILQNPYLLMNTFAGQLPAVALFFGLAHLVLRKFITIEIRPWVALGYIVAPTFVLALLGWDIRAEKYGDGIKLLVPLVLSTLACCGLYYQEWRRRISRKLAGSQAPSNGETADSRVVGNHAQNHPNGISQSVLRPSENGLSSESYCEQCGTPAKPGANYCHRCGHHLRTEIAPTPPQPDTPSEEAESKSIAESAPVSMIEESERVAQEPLPDSAPILSEGASVKHHPWRRLFARTVDMAIAVPLLYFLLFKNFGEAYPFVEWLVGTEGAVWLLTRPVATAALIIFLWVLIESVCLMAFGATLGKWAFGIRVLDAGGKKLSFGAAFARSWLALLFGQALGVPFVALITGLYSYRRLRRTGSTIWDQFAKSSVSYKNWAPVGMAVCAAVTMVAIVGFILTPVIIASLSKGYWTKRIEWAPEPAKSAVPVTPAVPESNQHVAEGRPTPEEFNDWFLSKGHPDWPTTIRTQEYIYWRDKVISDGRALRKAEDAALDSRMDTDDYLLISHRLSEFKKWKKTWEGKKQNPASSKAGKNVASKAASVASPPSVQTPPSPADKALTKEDIEEKKLTAAHPDWRTIIKTQEFQYWRDSVISDGQALMKSEDAAFISRRLSEFKKWRKERSN